MAAVLHEVAVDLRLDVGDGFGVLLQPGNVDFNVEMANIYLALVRMFCSDQSIRTANNGIILHDLKMCAGQDISASSSCDEDLTCWGCFLHCSDLVAGYSSL